MPPKVESPYVGLVPYTESDAPFFFGRERDQQRILANLFASRLTILYGASGVGKSSVLRAGIVNEVRDRIEQSRQAGEPPEIAVVYFKDWKDDVLGKLRAAISEALVSLTGQDPLRNLPPATSLENLLVAAGTGMGGDLLLILDQFEEYFLYHAASAPDDFAVQFAAAANRSGLPANFLISLRDDAIAKLDRFKALIPNLFSNYLRIQHLTGEGARDAILKPVERYNALPDESKVQPGRYTVEAPLVGEVIEQAHRGRVLIGQVGQGRVAAAQTVSAVETPYLQLVMTRLWKEEVSDGSHALRSETLVKLGGAETIIKSHLEKALEGLSLGDREICARMFPHLVTPSGSKIAHTVPNLAKFAKVTTQEVEPLLKLLAGPDKRILTPVAPPDGRAGELQYEIYHDSLAQAVLDWQARYEAEREAGARAKEKHRVQVIAVTLFIAFVIALGAAGVAAWQYHIASEERQHAQSAEEAARRAEAQALELKVESDQMHLIKEKAEAEKANNAELVKRLSQQIQVTQNEAAKFSKQAKAPAPAVYKDTLAEVIRDRDTLRKQVNEMEQKLTPQQQRYLQMPASAK
ncbi:MAG: ATP-binding protein [Candidatus Solibacter sp.]